MQIEELIYKDNNLYKNDINIKIRNKSKPKYPAKTIKNKAKMYL